MISLIFQNFNTMFDSKYLSINQMQNLNSQPEWEDIAHSLMQVSEQVIDRLSQKRPCGKYNLMEPYTFVFNKCSEKPSKSQQMLSRFKQLSHNHLIRSSLFQDGCNYISEFNRIWEYYSTYIKILSRQVFSYLDRYFLPSREEISLEQVATNLFEKQLLGVPSKRKIFIESFVKNLGEMRNNLIITDNHLQKFSVYVLKINPGMYKQLKKVYFEQTRNFYQLKYNESKHLDPIHYFNRIHNLAFFEDAIAKLCFLTNLIEIQNQRGGLQLLFAKQLVETYTESFLNHPRGILWALNNQNVALLNVVVQVYSKFQGFEKIKKRYYEYIMDESKKIVDSLQTEVNDQKKIITISEFFLLQNKILTTGFFKHKELYVTMTNALQSAIGKWQKLPQILMNYCKKVVNSGLFKFKSQIIRSVFQKLSNKDEFIQKCEQWMESIILSEKVQLQHQHQFLSFMHDICGGENTLKLHQILADYMEENKHHKNSVGNLECKVLSYMLWEKRFKHQLILDPILPPQLAQIWKSFEHNYTQIYSKKKIQILPHSSKMILQFNLNKQLLLVRCNLLQSCIIFALAQRGKSLKQLQQETNIDKALLIGFFDVAKFVTAKEQVFEIDWNFQSSGEFDLNLQVEQISKYSKAIQQDRNNNVLQAGVVRVMKKRKQTVFQQLYSYLCQNIKLFRPETEVVHKVIQKLINRGYLEMNEKGQYLYKE